MRLVLIGLAAVTAVLCSDIAAAQRAPRPWCFQGGRGSPGGGLPDCSFYTLEQCRGTIGGGNEGCFRNPALDWDRIEGQRAKQPPRR